MNNQVKSLLRIACPDCGAAIGVRCSLEAMQKRKHAYLPVCLGRMMRARANMRASNLAGLKPVKPKGQETRSYACRHANHTQCSGSRRLNHGLTTPCSCDCHKQPEK